MPFKDFVAGEVLAAADVDTYLMRQTVMSFASIAARDAALAGVLAEGMVAYVADADSLTVYSGVGWEVLSEPPQTWAPVIQQGLATVSSTTAYGWFHRSRGSFHATAAVNLTGAGTVGEEFNIELPMAIVNTEAVGGSFTYVDSGTSVYSGSVYPSTTLAFTLQANAQTGRLGETPSFAAASGDVIRVHVFGRYA